MEGNIEQLPWGTPVIFIDEDGVERKGYFATSDHHSGHIVNPAIPEKYRADAVKWRVQYGFGNKWHNPMLQPISAKEFMAAVTNASLIHDQVIAAVEYINEKQLNNVIEMQKYRKTYYGGRNGAA